MSAARFRIAQRDSDNVGEVHLAGCAHLTMGRRYPWGSTEGRGETAIEVAEEWGRWDGMVAELAPCARKGTGVKAGTRFGSADY